MSHASHETKSWISYGESGSALRNDAIYIRLRPAQPTWWNSFIILSLKDEPLDLCVRSFDVSALAENGKNNNYGENMDVRTARDLEALGRGAVPFRIPIGWALRVSPI